MRLVSQSDRYVVVEKPAGMLSVPGRGAERQDCVATQIGVMFPGARGPMVVHRLDMETSGLMVLALDPEAQRELSMQFERRIVEKAYVALLGERQNGPATDARGQGLDPLNHETGEIRLPLRADIADRPRQVIDHEHGRTAVTRWRILSRETDRVRVQMVPITGRTHQLRLHAAYGLLRPIIGDSLYAGAEAERLMLHAAQLSFIEPGSKRRVEFESRAPF